MTNILHTLTEVYNTLEPLSATVAPEHTWAQIIGNRPNHLRVMRCRDIAEMQWPDEYRLQRKFLESCAACIVFPLTYFGVLIGYGFRDLQTKRFSIIQPVSFSSSFYTAYAGVKQCKQRQFMDAIVIVEGVADAEAVGACYPWVVAVLGNHITDPQYAVLRSTTGKIYTMFDNDVAGQNGTRKAQKLFKEHILLEHKALAYPAEYKDPAEYYLHDAAGLKRRLRGMGL